MKKIINLLSIFTFIGLIYSNAALSQENKNLTALITNTDQRNYISLDGKWHIIIDRYENGYYDYRMEPSTEGYMKNQKMLHPSDRVEYDFDKSPLINVPGDWNSQRKELLYYEGTVWYKKTFNYQRNNDSRVFLYFGAINYHAIVYLNGKEIGQHIGGFTPFNFEITESIVDGENFIVVKIDNSRKSEAVPTVKTDWWNYGGITRSVKLIEVPSTFIRDYFIQLDRESAQLIKGWITLDGEYNSGKSVTLEIPELKLKQNFVSDANGKCPFEFKSKPELWTPNNPKLYALQIKTEFDVVTDKIGFRTIKTRGTDILLNNEPVFLRGVCIHEEAPFRSGRAFSKEDAQVLLGWAKEMGCNFVRLAHYPHNEHMTRMADEMGMLVWSEIPVYWTILWDNEKTLQNAKNQLSEMITRDKNKASVIIWSMSNETPVSDSRNDFLKTLVDKTRSMDNTRLVSAALEKEYRNEDPYTPIVDDPFGEFVDVLSFNEYIGWYDGLPDKCQKVNWIIEYNKPVIISEFGAGALQGYHGNREERWTEDYQAWTYEESILMLDKIEKLRGVTPWILMDFRSPNRVLPGIQDGWNRKGLISDQGNRKEAFYIMKEWYEILRLKWEE